MEGVEEGSLPRATEAARTGPRGRRDTKLRGDGVCSEGVLLPNGLVPKGLLDDNTSCVGP